MEVLSSITGTCLAVPEKKLKSVFLMVKLSFITFSHTFFSQDMCHLKPHSEKPKQAKVNDITMQFAGIVKAVDNFHFKKGHKGKWCQENANPNVEMKKVGMVHANTPVCEQFFSWINKYKNIKLFLL